MMDREAMLQIFRDGGPAIERPLRQRLAAIRHMPGPVVGAVRLIDRCARRAGCALPRRARAGAGVPALAARRRLLLA
jgi:hypothetical protein